MRTHPYRAKIQRQLRQMSEVCKQFQAVPYATPLIDLLETAEGFAERLGRNEHRVWRAQYEAARSQGKCIQDAIVEADKKLMELFGEKVVAHLRLT